MGDAIHAERREPRTPDGAVDLAGVCDELLADAAGMDAGRAARTLTPGAHADLKQTLVALVEGRRLDAHTTNGHATIQVLRGRVVMTPTGGDAVELPEGHWAVVPDEEHDVQAEADAVVLVTVALDTQG